MMRPFPIFPTWSVICTQPIRRKRTTFLTRIGSRTQTCGFCNATVSPRDQCPTDGPACRPVPPQAPACALADHQLHRIAPARQAAKPGLFNQKSCARITALPSPPARMRSKAESPTKLLLPDTPHGMLTAVFPFPASPQNRLQKSGETVANHVIFAQMGRNAPHHGGAQTR